MYTPKSAWFNATLPARVLHCWIILTMSPWHMPQPDRTDVQKQVFVGIFIHVHACNDMYIYIIPNAACFSTTVFLLRYTINLLYSCILILPCNIKAMVAQAFSANTSWSEAVSYKKTPFFVQWLHFLYKNTMLYEHNNTDYWIQSLINV